MNACLAQAKQPRSKWGFTAAILLPMLLSQVALADNLLQRGENSGFESFGSLDVDDGGSLLARVHFVQLHRDDPTYRLPMECYSSCTLLLAIRGACVTPGSHLYFHSASLDGRRSPRWSAYAMGFYPETIRRWIIAHRALDRLRFTALDWQSAERLGVRVCE
jgi:hypothetical protein